MRMSEFDVACSYPLPGSYCV